MRRTIVAGNWKMNKTVDEPVELAKGVVAATKGAETETVVCPGYPCLVPARDAIAGSHVVPGAQDVDHRKNGASRFRVG